MRRTLGALSVLALCFTGHCGAAEEWGDLTTTFIYEGDAPQGAALQVTKDTELCGKFNLLDESLTVNAKNKGIANVVAFVYLAKDATKPAVHLAYQDGANAKIKLDNNCCRFAPHVVMLRTSQTLLMTNSDAVAHSCKIDTLSNLPINTTIPPDGNLDHSFLIEERLPAKVSCALHPWMSGYLVIRESPYMGISDENGKLVIKNLPVGKWTFQFWHEKAGNVRNVQLNGKATQWTKGRVELTIKPGANALGEIKLAPAAFTD